jgi:hypothetical protein
LGPLGAADGSPTLGDSGDQLQAVEKALQSIGYKTKAGRA